MKLWTLQRDCVAESLSQRHLVNWEFTPLNWRVAYDWMAHHLAKHLGRESKHAPVWCWHSCDGKFGSGPTVSTANALMGDWDYHAHRTRVIELEVPDQLPLLSSYSMWNELLEVAMTTEAMPALDIPFIAMFEPPYFQHDWDDIQAVLPYIEAEWVVATRLLPANADAPQDFI
jgi:hypothetical protein